MKELNTEILSEITNLQVKDVKVKNFIQWLLNFENDNVQKENYPYKADIEGKLFELLDQND